MDEDEEVIFEGGPLYSHLQKTGHENFEYEKRETKPNNDNILSQKLFNKEEKRKLDMDNLRVTSLKLLKNGILVEDFMVMDNFSNGNDLLFSENNKRQTLQNILKKCQSRLFISIKLLFLVCGIIYLALLPIWYFSNWYTYMGIILLLTSFTLSGFCISATRRSNNAHCKLDLFVELSQRLLKACAISQKILNEMNFITKQSDLKFLTSAHKSLSISQEQVMDDFSLLLMNGHNTLKNTDSNLTMLSAFFDERVNGYYDCYNVPTHRVTSTLKFKQKRLKEQFSGFITEFILLTEVFDRHSYDPACHFSSIIDDCKLSQLAEKVFILEKCIQFAKRVWFEAEAVPNSVVEPINKNSKLMSVFRIMNSLSRSGKTFLTTFYNLEKLLQNLGVHSDFLECEEAYVADINIFCDKLTAEIQSCSGCIEEIRSIVSSRKIRVTEPQPTFRVSNRVDLRQNPTVGTEDQIILDEVFETYVTAAKAVNSLQGTFVDDERDENEAMIAQKRHCKNVLKEMQPILQKRRTMCREREEIALKRASKQESFKENMNPSDTLSEETNQKSKCEGISTKSRVVVTFHCNGTESPSLEISNEPSQEEVQPIATKIPTEIFEGNGISDVLVVAPNPLSLEERISSWGGNVGLGLKSVLEGSNHIPKPSPEQVFL